MLNNNLDSKTSDDELYSEASRNEKSQQGMTLLEVIIVLGIIGIISAGVITLAQRAFDSQAMNKAVSNVNSVQLAVSQTYRASGGYPATSALADGVKLTKTLVRMGTISKEESMSPFTTDTIPVLGVKNNTKPGKAFVLVLSGLDETQCRSLVRSADSMFSFIQTAADTTSLPTDIYTKADATKALGVIKSPDIQSVNFDVSNLTHTDVLCNGASVLYLGNS